MVLRIYFNLHQGFTHVFQDSRTTPAGLALPVSGAVDLDPPFCVLQALTDPFLELVRPTNVNLARGEASAQILRLQERPMWRESPAGPLTNAPWVGL